MRRRPLLRSGEFLLQLTILGLVLVLLTGSASAQTVTVEIFGDSALEGAEGVDSTLTFEIWIGGSGIDPDDNEPLPADVSLRYDTVPTAQPVQGTEYDVVGASETYTTYGIYPISVTIHGDDVDEDDEQIIMQLSNVVNAEVDFPRAFGTIEDDDGPCIYVDNSSATEGDSGTTPATFRVYLTEPGQPDVPLSSPQAITVGTFIIEVPPEEPVDSDFVATIEQDFLSPTYSQVRFAAGETEQLVDVDVVGDLIDEFDEIFYFDLASSDNATICDGRGIGTIIDDDGPNITIADEPEIIEGDAGSTTWNFTVTLGQTSGEAVSVDYDAIAVTAESGVDYALASGSLTIPAGELTGTIAVTIFGDLLDEDNETFQIKLSNPDNGRLVDDLAVGTILDDEEEPTLSSDSPSVVEGDEDSTTLTFTVELSAASGRTVTVDYAITDGTATAGDDYVAISDTLTFSPGVTSLEVDVTVLGDLLSEINETVRLTLSDATNATVPSPQVFGTITDNDAFPDITIDDVQVTEGTDDTVSAVFTVTLSEVSGQDVTVKYETVDNTALAGEDFTGLTTTTLTIPAGVRSRQVTVTILGDATDEPTETYFVLLTDPTAGAITKAEGLGTIVDDDGPKVSITASVSIPEGDAPGPVIATVTITAPPVGDVEVDWRTANGAGAGGATTPDDYEGDTGTLVFNETSGTSQTIEINISDDSIDEVDEHFVISLISVRGGSITFGESLVTIIDDDGPEISVAGFSELEGNGEHNEQFRLTLSNSSPQDVTVYVETEDGSAEAGSDYNAITRTAVTFRAGNTSQNVNLRVLGDTVHEFDEDLKLLLSDPDNATIAVSEATGILRNDDGPVFTVSQEIMVDEDAGEACFKVTLDDPSPVDVSVDFDTSEDTAVEPEDFTNVSQTVEITAGDLDTTICVPIVDDELDEDAEIFDVRLSNPSHDGGWGDRTGIGLILDNDLEPTVEILTPEEGTLEPDTGQRAMTFTVRLNTESGRRVRLRWRTQDGTGENPAERPDDYTRRNDVRLDFAAGETEKTITVQIQGDFIDEWDETFTVELYEPENVVIEDGEATGTILDNDPEPTVSVEPGDSPRIVEGDEGDHRTLRFRVYLSLESQKTITVRVRTQGGTPDIDLNEGVADEDVDYVGYDQVITFDPGDDEEFVDITIEGDDIDERDEVFEVYLTDPTNAELGDDSTEGVIDDDDGPSFCVLTAESHTVSHDEGDDGPTFYDFAVTMSDSSPQQTRVTYGTTGDTATSGGDFVARGGTLVFDADTAELTQTVRVEVNGDTAYENDEYFILSLSNAVDAEINPDCSTGNGEILNDDDVPELCVASTSVDEPDSGTRNMVFTVTRRGESELTASVDYETVAGTAEADVDYVEKNGTITIGPSTSITNFSVQVRGDRIDEDNETFFISLLEETLENATIDTDCGRQGTIIDNDAEPELIYSNVTELERTSEGYHDLVYVVTLSAQSQREIQVDYHTTSGTATQGTDYTGVSDTLTFEPGITRQEIRIPIREDAIDEVDETFTLTFDDPDNVLILRPPATITIDDDDGPQICVQALEINEGALGATTSALVTISLSADSPQDVSVSWTTRQDSATQGDDYNLAQGRITFSAHNRTQQVEVLINGDNTYELNEVFDIVLSGATDAVLFGDACAPEGEVTILNDDEEPTIVIENLEVLELDGGTRPISMRVGLSAASDVPVNFNFQTLDGTAVTTGSVAEGTLDYTAIESTPQTIGAGSTSIFLTLFINGDVVDEQDELFTVQLLDIENATPSATNPTVKIIDDDGPRLLADEVQVEEGNAGDRNQLEYSLCLDETSAQDVVIEWETSAGSATNNVDYFEESGTATILAGDSCATVSITIKGDLIDEDNETLFIDLTNVTNARPTTTRILGRILDDDGAPTLNIDSVQILEGDEGRKNLRFTVTRSGLTSQTITFSYETLNGTATAVGVNPDYISQFRNNVELAPSDSTFFIDIAIVGDLIDEDNETFFVFIKDAVNAEIGTGEGIGTILDDDLPPEMSVEEVSVLEGHEGTVDLVFSFEMSAPSGQSVTVDYQTRGVTATEDDDYEGAEGRLVIEAGSRRGTVVVKVNGDRVFEPDETLVLQILGVTNISFDVAEVLGTIRNDDQLPTLQALDGEIVEGDEGTKQLLFTLRLSNPTASTVSGSHSTSALSATDSVDYVGIVDGSFTIAPGETETQVSVTVIGDLLHEIDELLVLAVSEVTGAALTVDVATGTIIDDDDPPGLSIELVGEGYSIVEGDDDDKELTFNFTLSEASGRPVTVSYVTEAGTATSDVDYTHEQGSLEILTGTTGSVTITILGDYVFEDDETFILRLSDPVGATLVDETVEATIIDNDHEPEIVIGDVEVTEPDEGSINAVFVVTLSNASAFPVTVTYETADVSAVDGDDYTGTAAPAPTVTIEPGDTTAEIPIAVLGDYLDENDELFSVNLTEATNGSIEVSQGIGTIRDNDGTPGVSASTVDVLEGDEGTVEMVFVVTLTNPSASVVSVLAATNPVSARADVDYVSFSERLEFASGEVEKTVTVLVNGDILDELNESLELVLSDPDGIEVTGNGLGVILDDDATPEITIDDVEVTEGDEGFTEAVFTVSLSSLSGSTVTVDFVLTDDTAVSDADFLGESGRVTFEPGENTATITVMVRGDTEDEVTENYTVDLSEPTNAELRDGQGLGTIYDDDIAVYPDLELVKTHEGDPLVGEDWEYSLTVTNIGSGPTIGGLTITDDLPDGLSYVDFDGEDWDCAAEDGLITCESDAVLEVDASSELVLVVHVEADAYPRVVNEATVVTEEDRDPDNNESRDPTRVRNRVDLSVTKTDDERSASPGQDLAYTLTVSNLGPAALTSLRLDEELDEWLIDVSFEPEEGSYDEETGLWSGIDLQPDTSVVMIVYATIDPETTADVVVNTVVVDVPGAFGDPDPENNTATDETDVMIGEGADCDGDGLSDDEEYELGTDPCNEDTDGDGIPDDVEVEGENPTDPTNPDSDGDGLCDGPVVVEGECEGGEDLNGNGQWDPGETRPDDPDGDGDGIDDIIELEGENPTDPTDPDTDGDGLCDGPNTVEGECVGGEDMDGDGERDDDETDPNVVDTDGDGLSDGLETLGENPTDPLDPDTDDDLLCDGPADVELECRGGEDENENGIVDPDETDPLIADTDNGGVPDGREVLYNGTDPLDGRDDYSEASKLPSVSGGNLFASPGCECTSISQRGGPVGVLMLVGFALALRRRRGRS